MIVLDAHCDAPSQMYRGRDFSKDNPEVQVDFPKMKLGGVDASFFAAYVPAELKGQDATDHATALIDAADRQVAANADKVAYARCSSGVRRNKAAGLTSVLLGIENASAIQESFELLRAFYKRGVRYLTLTHSEDNQVGDSCTGKGRWGGLSPFGKTLIPEMNRCRMMIDVAHAADSTIRDVLELSAKPIAYTHGCCRALCSHPRNLSDELIRGIAERGGVVCMSIYPCFLVDGYDIDDPSSVPPGVERVVDHIEHAVSVAGVEHVGLGTDYDGIDVTAKGFEDISKFGLLWEEMRRRGFSDKEMRLIAGENILRVMKEVRKGL